MKKQINTRFAFYRWHDNGLFVEYRINELPHFLIWLMKNDVAIVNLVQKATY